jgi:lysozyme family protein
VIGAVGQVLPTVVRRIKTRVIEKNAQKAATAAKNAQSVGKIVSEASPVDESELPPILKISRGNDLCGLLARWETMEVNRPNDAMRAAKTILANRARYEAAAKTAGKTPWFVVGLIHCMEADFSFKTHLHNGDSLNARTRNEPSGRPIFGGPPFGWEESAADALAYDGFDKVIAWDLVTVLNELERYNGLGYRKYHPETPSPYLWSGSNHYTAGKYVADGSFSETAVSSQIGCAPVLSMLFTLMENAV